MVNVTVQTQARNLTAQEQTLVFTETVKIRKNDIGNKYDSVCSACNHLGYIWQADQLSVGAIIAKHHVLETSSQATVTWVDANNVEHTLSWLDFVSLKDRLFSFHESAFANKNALRSAIDALVNSSPKPTVAQISAYDITTGWPT